MSPNQIITLISTPSTILVLDGGISTHLELILQKPFPDRNLWSSSLLLSIQGQKQIQQAHYDFLNAGCNIVSTVTYQLSHFATRFGYSEELIDTLLNVAVEQAIEAIQNIEKQEGTTIFTKKRFIFASIGCYGSALADGSEYTGKYSLSKEELKDFHSAKFNLFRRNSCVHGILFETIPSKIEVEAILQLIVGQKQCTVSDAQNERNNAIICLSLACQNGSTLNDGTPLTTVLDLIVQVDPSKDEQSRLVHCIGVNCCKIQYIYSLSKLIAEHILKSKIRRIIALYPNSGEEWDAQNNCWKIGSGCSDPKAYANELLKCIQGIHDLCQKYDQPNLPIIVGGCCRTSPETISALRQAVDQYDAKNISSRR